MDNQTNQTTPASEQLITEAKQLLQQVDFSDPANRLVSETIILSKSETAITELMSTLRELLSDREMAYQEYKSKIANIAKEMLPAPTTPPATITTSSSTPTEFNPGLPGDTQPTQI